MYISVDSSNSADNDFAVFIVNEELMFMLFLGHRLAPWFRYGLGVVYFVTVYLPHSSQGVQVIGGKLK